MNTHHNYTCRFLPITAFTNFVNCLCFFSTCPLKKHKVSFVSRLEIYSDVQSESTLNLTATVCSAHLAVPSAWSISQILKSTCSFVGWEATYYHTHFPWRLNNIYQLLRIITDVRVNEFLRYGQHVRNKVINFLQRTMSFQTSFSDTKNKMASNQPNSSKSWSPKKSVQKSQKLSTSNKNQYLNIYLLQNVMSFIFLIIISYRKTSVSDFQFLITKISSIVFNNCLFGEVLLLHHCLPCYYGF